MLTVKRGCTASVLVIAAACTASDSSSSNEGFEFEVMPMDTILIVDSGPLTAPTEIVLAPDGSLRVAAGPAGLWYTVDPTTREAPIADSTAAAGPREGELLQARASDGAGGLWAVTDSLPRLQRTAEDGEVTGNYALQTSELTDIRVRLMYEAEQAGTEVTLRYANDLRVVQGAPWVLLNRRFDQQAVVLLFDDAGRQRGKILFPWGEGRTRFAVDETLKKIYMISTTPPQVAAFDLSPFPVAWIDG